MSTDTKKRLRVVRVTIEFSFAYVGESAQEHLKSVLRALDPADYAETQSVLASTREYSLPDGYADDDIVYGAYDARGNPVRWCDAVAADRAAQETKP